MPPKKKGNKKNNDDWDEGLGEAADPIAAATQAAKEDEAAQDDEEQAEGGGGGLLAALRKNRGKKQKKGKVVEDFVEGEDPPETNGENGDAKELEVDLAAKAPEEADMDDEDVFAAPVKKGKGGKAAKGGKATPDVAPTPPPEPQDDEDGEGDGDDMDDTGRIKTKKEKEKEKKEREKQRKKDNAKKKAPAAAPAKAEAAKPVEAAKAEPTPAADTTAGGKKKKVPAALAALQKQQEELRKQQEEDARAAAVEKAREEEEQRLEEEEAQRKLEAKAAKKQKEKEKIEQLKKEGKYMTDAQKKSQAAAKARAQQMIESGVIVAGLAEDGDGKKKKPVYDTKKKKGLTKKELEEKKAAEEEAAEFAAQAKKLEAMKLAEEQKSILEAETEKARADAEAKKGENGEDLEDWEAMADADDTGLKDSWDASSDDEDKPSAPAKTPSIPEKSTASARPAAAATNGTVNGRKPVEDDDESSVEDSSEEDSSDEETTAAKKAVAQKKAEAAQRREQRHQEALAARSSENLRSPICCILGHVDTGKTKLLDKIRQTNVQEGEAGGITQQIGATYFPVEALQKKTQVVNEDNSFKFNVPGLLVIDTPGHESFTNLRSRGSSLCNIAILVVDIMHGLEPQTLESMRLLRDRKTPFIVALNKIDRLYGWSRIDNNGFQDSLAMQKKSVQGEFERRVEETKLAFAEQGFNSELYYENKNMAKNVSLVPTSAHTGEGIPDMLKLIISLTQERMTGKLMYLSEVEATILEVKVVEGLGTTIDVILSNGVLREGDRVVLCGLNGPIATNIRALLTPAEMKELRVKSAYVHNKEVKAALGVKIAANDLEHAIAGSRLLVVGPDDDEEDMEEEVMTDLENLLGKVSKTGRGVSVQASTLGSLEALLEFLRTSKIPVANISIGPVFKRDVMQAGIMLEKAKEYAVMLCFDVKVDKDAQTYADEVGVKVFTADIIYHLFDDFTKHMAQLAEQKKEESKMLAVFPCVLKPVAVFNKKDPIVIGVDVIEGNLRLLTPLAAVKNNPTTGLKEIIPIGRV